MTTFRDTERRLARIELDKAESEPPAPPPSPLAVELEELRLRLHLSELKRLRDLCRDANERGFQESFKDPIHGEEIRSIFATARARTANVKCPVHGSIDPDRGCAYCSPGAAA